MIEFNHTEVEEEVAVDIALTGAFGIVLYNDDVNTFDHVINCLVKYCKHEEPQAEQCAMIVHYKGKCQVKNGSSEELQPICDALCRKGLSATLEELS
ncbi:MAG: ATP-dependent Clp protease adaptor ClpS [Bacteroidia bacterium]